MVSARLPQIWEIGLSSWIIQDGNYADFQAGQIAEFALEFWLPETTLSESQDAVSLSPCGDCLYEAIADVVILDPDLTVIDFGIQAFSDSSLAAKGLAQGKRFVLNAGLGVDPFFYFERLSKSPTVPPLVYSWRIASILCQTAPFMESADASGRKMLMRDPTLPARRQIDRTNAWHDDDGRAEYTLQCELLPIAPKRTSATAT